MTLGKNREESSPLTASAPVLTSQTKSTNTGKSNIFHGYYWCFSKVSIIIRLCNNKKVNRRNFLNFEYSVEKEAKEREEKEKKIREEKDRKEREDRERIEREKKLKEDKGKALPKNS